LRYAAHNRSRKILRNNLVQ